MQRHVACVGAVIIDDGGRLLLIRRARAPHAGSWSLPGGRVEAGESAPEAIVREVAEETGLTVTAGRLVGRVVRDGPDGVVYDIDDFVCTPHGGQLRAGDDASDVRYVDRAGLDRLALSPGLLQALAGWSVLPR